MKKAIYNILKGTYLVSDGSYKKWRLIIFFSSLALVMIASSHSADSKVHKIAKLHEDVKFLRSSYVETRSKLMELKMESYVINKMKNCDIFPSKRPSVKIIINSIENKL